MKPMTRTSGQSLLLGLLLTLGLTGCADKIEPLHVGSKQFTESLLLAEMTALMAENEGIPVKRSIPYGNPFQNFEGIKQGAIDVYPEYNGTGLVYLGQAPLTDGDESLARVRELYKPLDLEWKDRYGFSNDYALVMRPDQAAELGIESISDLEKFGGGVRFVTDQNFTERPLDGLGAMLRRYGLNKAESLAFKLDEDGKPKIFQALLDGEADVAEVFATDGQIAAYGLKILTDDLEFFPVYDAAPIVRGEALARHPNLSGALQKLAGKIDATAMQKMNGAVDLDGRSFQEVAREFLIEQKLLPEGGAIEGAEELLVSAGTLDELAGTAGRALRAVRTAFPGRAVKVIRSADPIRAVVNGKARVGLVSAESFFRVEGDVAVPAVPAEALGVVGYQTGHLIGRRSDGPASLKDMKSIGVGELNGASHRTAKMIVEALGLPDTLSLVGDPYGNLETQVQALKSGQLDGLFLMLPIGHKTVKDTLDDTAFKLIGIDGWTAGNAPIRFSFLRPSKIPDGTYDGQSSAIESVNAQLVIAGPTSVAEELGGRGPGTAGTTATQPLPDSTIVDLNKALGAGELVDPAMPTAPALKPEIATAVTALKADVAISFTNFITICVLVYLFYLFAKKDERDGLD